MSLNVLIIAAGLGTRMKSRRAKVLHPLLGKPLIGYGLKTALELDPTRVMIVIGYEAEAVRSAVEHEVSKTGGVGSHRVEFVLQKNQLGTGHAVIVAREALAEAKGLLVVFYGDVPLIEPQTIRKLIDHHRSGAYSASLMTVVMENPSGYGRIVRDAEGQFAGIVEHRDASPEQLIINEVNPAMYCFEIDPLLSALDCLSPKNAQGEYYLPDVFRLLQDQGHKIGVLRHDRPEEFEGVNNRIELANLGARLRCQVLNRHMMNGVTIIDPGSTYVSVDAVIGQDTIIHPQVVIEGDTVVGQECEIQSWSRVDNSTLGDRVMIKNGCVIIGSRLGNDTTVGPFAHLRAGAELADEAAVGDFVEVKNSRLGRRSKAMHLTYLGDATIGERANIGAGTITCNYDGKRKHRTTIEDDVRIGSDTMLVAPVRIGRGSVTGAGSVVTKDVPEHSLAVGVPAVVKKKLQGSE